MPNEGNIKTSISLILLKCIVAFYSNGNESFTGTLFSNYGLLNMLFYFFFSLIVFFTTHFLKVLFKNYPFQAQISKSISRCTTLLKIRMSNFVILKWEPSKYKVKSWKICPFLGLFFQKQKMLRFWIFHESNILVMISHLSWKNIYGSTIVEFTGHRTWLQIGVSSRKNCPRHGFGQISLANS